MKLVELKDWVLQPSEEVWGLEPFKKILKRDKTKNKSNALKELLFIYFYTDIRSDYLVTPEKDRSSEIIKDIGLPDKWKIDSVIKEAIDFYSIKSKSTIEKLYEDSMIAATDIGNYLRGTKELLKERDSNGKPIYDISKITTSLQKVPKLMKDLREAYKEVVKEQEDRSNKKSGSRSHNLFEDGI